MAGSPRPRLVVTDTLGRRIVGIDKPVFTIGRRTESDLRLAGADISRLHAEIAVEGGVCVLRDKDSRFGTFVNGERVAERALAHADQIRFGQAGETDIVFFVDEDAPSVEKSAVMAATELRQMAALLEGLRALGSGRVLDEVLALVLDSAIEVTGAERGFIMLANREQRARVQAGARARARHAVGQDVRDEPQDSRVRVRHRRADHRRGSARRRPGASAHAARWRSGFATCSARRSSSCATSSAPTNSAPKRSSACCTWTAASAARSSPTSARQALDTLSAEATIAIENARLYREALDRAKFEQELKVAAAIQQALLPPGARRGEFFTTAAASIACRTVGGDFFDYVDLPSGQFGFILGDVAGKGSPAALLAAAAIGMFSVEAMYQTRPSALMTRLNHGIMHRAHRIALPDVVLRDALQGRRLRVLQRRPQSSDSRVGVRRAPARNGRPSSWALRASPSFEEETLKLSPGDVIVSFSDGVTEALNPAGDEFTDERLLASVDAHRGKSPQGLVDGVLADVRAFCGDATQSDDVTIVLVRYEGC